MKTTKFRKAEELAKFLKLGHYTQQNLYAQLAGQGWRWDRPSQKWIHASNHPGEIGK